MMIKNATNRIQDGLVSNILAMVLTITVAGCDPPCIFDPCDDGDPCTVDACLGDRIAECTHTPIDCADQFCNPENGECVDCVEDANCADGEFCNGFETCVDNACFADVNPCGVGAFCDEQLDECAAE